MSLRSSTRTRVAAAALFLIGAYSVAWAPTVRAAPTPIDALATAPNGRIAYVAFGPSTIPFGPPEQTDIWVMNPDGTGRTNLTDTSDVDEMSPAWSPDGTRIAYISDSFTNTLTVMNADGSARTPLLVGAYSPSWSPEGTEVAVLWSDGVDVTVLVVDVLTGARSAIGGADLRPAMEPVWSPDGASLAVVSVRPEFYPDPITGDPIEGAQHEIVVVSLSDFGEVVVSAGEPGSERATYLEEDRAPAWSPDGSMLVFMSQAQVPSCCGQWQLWAVNRDGTGLTNLTADDSVADTYPSWSPDGSTIVFTRATGTGGDLYTIPAPTVLPLPLAGTAAPRAVPAAVTGAATPLTTDGNAADPSWGRRPARPIRLTVAIQSVGGATGRVVSSPPGIACGTDCTQRFPVGTTVTLSARQGAGSRFVRWSGACSGTAPTCSVELNEVSRVTARFRDR